MQFILVDPAIVANTCSLGEFTYESNKVLLSNEHSSLSGYDSKLVISAVSVCEAKIGPNQFESSQKKLRIALTMYVLPIRER